MKYFLTAGVIALAAIFLMGMGNLGGNPAINQVPSPEKNFSVRVVDREGVETSLAQFSLNGQTALTGKRGSAIVVIPFEKISSIQFENPEKDDIVAKIILQDEASIEMRLEKRSKFYGQAQFGSYQIEAKDVKSVRFRP